MSMSPTLSGLTSRVPSATSMKEYLLRRRRGITPAPAVSQRPTGSSDTSEDVPPLTPKPPLSRRAATITPESARELLEELLDAEKFGSRGEGWFLAQMVGILLVLFPPDGVRQIVDTLGGVMVVSGLALITLGTISLGQNLTPLPVPRDEHSLVTDGVYELVRHPMYGGILLSALGLAVATGDEARLALGALLFLLLNQKAAVEEEALEERYGAEYTAYKGKSKKFIPWLF